MPETSSAIAQLDGLIHEIEPGIRQHDGGMGVGTYHVFEAPEHVAQRLMTRAIAAVERLAPRDSRYVGDATRDLLQQHGPRSSLPILVGILHALREDYAAGYMRSIEELIHANVFADFLEMADELLGKNYKDPAAVIAGSVLEEHLRKLAVVYSVAVAGADGKPRKADVINADLVKAAAYNKLEQKSITAWLGLRNDAAHGQYDEYDKDQVASLIRDVRAFMIRHRA